jgi:hypothetical protein
VAELPRGTVSLLFTDIEGSTQLQHRLQERYRQVVTDHRRLLEDVIDLHGGLVVDRQTESFFAAFPRMRDAAAAAADAQRPRQIVGSISASCRGIHVVAVDDLRPADAGDGHVFDVGRRQADCRERIAHVPSKGEMVSVRRKDVDDDKSAALASPRDRVNRTRGLVAERLLPRLDGPLVLP